MVAPVSSTSAWYWRMRLSGPLPPSIRSMRSIHCQLPRSMPSSFFTNVRDVKLTGVRFRSFDDLAHLVAELRSRAKWFTGESLTWDGGEPLSAARKSPRSTNVKEVHLENCIFNWVALCLLSPVLYSYLHEDDCSFLNTLVQEITRSRSCYKARCLYPDRSQFSTGK